MGIKKFPNHTPENYLKAILESIEEYNSHARADISNLLYEGYKKAGKVPEKAISKKTIIIELLSKWIQIFEDIGLLGVMFGGAAVGEKRQAHEIYMSTHPQLIMRFFNKAKKGLSDKIVMSIYGLKSARQLVKGGVINQGEVDFFEKEIKNGIESGRTVFKNIAREYVGKKRRKKEVIDASFLVNISAQARHGYKVIQYTKTSKELWEINKDDIVIAEGIGRARWNKKRNLIRVGIFREFTDEEVAKLVERINGWSDVVEDISLTQTKKMGNPNWFVKGIRRNKTKKLISEGVKRPSRNQNCICGSLIKFKKCCESEL